MNLFTDGPKIVSDLQKSLAENNRLLSEILAELKKANSNG